MDSRNRRSLMIVGASDVDARIPLALHLSRTLDVAAVGTDPGLAQSFASNRIPYFSYRMDRRVNPLGDFRAYLELRSLFRREKPDIVHAFDSKPCVWARLAAHSAKVPVVLGTNTGLGSLYVGSGWKKRIIRCCYEVLQRAACGRSDLTVFYNREDSEQFIRAGIVGVDRQATIPGSGISTGELNAERFSSSEVEAMRREFGCGADEILVTMVSRVYRSKGPLEFALAGELVREVRPDVVFVLVGATDRETFDRLSIEEEHRLSQTIRWVGHRQDIPAILAATDIFVLPTYYREGIPRSLIEAAAMGLPLVATDIPGCREIVVDGVNGFLLPSHDARAIANCVLELSADKERRAQLGRNSRKRAVDQFDLGIIASRYLEVYDALLRDRPRASRVPLR